VKTLRAEAKTKGFRPLFVCNKIRKSPIVSSFTDILLIFADDTSYILIISNGVKAADG